MNFDAFEQCLQRQPSRTIPSEWRAEMLSAAKAASTAAHAPHLNPEHRRDARRFQHGRSLLSTFNSQLSTLLWPSPAAWAGLAAIWVVILVVNSTSGGGTKELARKITPPAPEAIAAWKEQERLLTELIGRPEAPAADRPKPVAPRPRSERQNGFSLA